MSPFGNRKGKRRRRLDSFFPLVFGEEEERAWRRRDRDCMKEKRH